MKTLILLNLYGKHYYAQRALLFAPFHEVKNNV
nr:MAG TPA: Protein of unknown function (DUF1296) [Caudoviricetes sp.]